MTKEKLNKVKNEAHELLIRITHLEADSHWSLDKYNCTNKPVSSGAVKRQSMELTRALADLRRP